MRLGFLASGRGSNMKAILDRYQQEQLAVTPVTVISNNADSGAIELATEYGLSAHHLSTRVYPDATTLDRLITQTLQEEQVELVILAGYMKKIGPQLLTAYRERILNIHPSLLPDFGGQGMYGMRVHEAVIAAGVSETGATVHLVNEEYDQGRILAQRQVMVSADDTAETLAKKVLAVEHQLYPDTINKIVNGDILLKETSD